MFILSPLSRLTQLWKRARALAQSFMLTDFDTFHTGVAAAAFLKVVPFAPLDGPHHS